jgi:hypothetical protein
MKGRSWRKAAVRRNVRCWANNGKHMLALMFSAVDPTRTSVGTREFGSRAAIAASEPTGVNGVIDHSIKPRAAQSVNKIRLVHLPGRSGVKNAKQPV